MSDEELVQDLADNWSYEDPPVEFLKYDEEGSTLLEIRRHETGPVYCIGEGPPDDEGFMCDDTCFATLCFSKRDGIVVLDGTWAPEDMRFSQPTYAGS